MIVQRGEKLSMKMLFQDTDNPGRELKVETPK